MSYPKNRISKKASRPYTNKEWFYEQYIEMNKSSSQIALEVGCKKDTIKMWAKIHGIKKGTVRGYTITALYQNKEYLYNEHIVKKRPIYEIAAENAVDGCTITHWLKKYKIEYWITKPETLDVDEKEVVTLYTSGISENQTAQILGCSRDKIRAILEKNDISRRDLSMSQFAALGKNKPIELNKEWLYQHYILMRENSCDIAKQINIDPSTVIRYLKKFNIQIRDCAESKIGIVTGESHPNWKGGKTPLDLLLREYFNINLAPIAAKRDKYTCQKCGAQHTILHVHHIIHFKDIVDQIISEHPEININDNNGRQQMYNIIVHDERFLNIDNLTTLCKSCHRKIHSKKTTSSQASVEEGSETIENPKDE